MSTVNVLSQKLYIAYSQKNDTFSENIPKANTYCPPCCFFGFKMTYKSSDSEILIYATLKREKWSD